jgi:hypothetical protein
MKHLAESSFVPPLHMSFRAWFSLFKALSSSDSLKKAFPRAESVFILSPEFSGLESTALRLSTSGLTWELLPNEALFHGKKGLATKARKQSHRAHPCDGFRSAEIKSRFEVFMKKMKNVENRIKLKMKFFGLKIKQNTNNC